MLFGELLAMIRPRLRHPVRVAIVAMATAVAMVILTSTAAFAHGSGHAVRYVASDGTDRGDCSQSAAPCKTLAYAFSKSGKGDSIRVAEGSYHLRGVQRVNLLTGVVPISGGYSRADGFAKADRQRHPTLLTGIPADYRADFESKGFQVVQDGKGADIALSVEETRLVGTWQKISKAAVAGPANCTSGKADVYDCANVDLLAHIPLSAFSTRPSSANDIWGFADRNDGREYALIGLSNGTAVVDITDPSAPREVGTVAGPSSLWRDVHVFQHFDEPSNRYRAYAYVSTEAGGGGVQVIDLSALPTRVSLAYTIRDVQSAHTLYVNADYADGTALPGTTPSLFVAGSDVVVSGKTGSSVPNRSRGSWRAYDLANPAQPVFVHQPVSTGSYMHDGTSAVITDARASQCAPGHQPCEILFDFNEDTLDIWDVTERAAPVRLTKMPYDGVGYSHSGWYTDGARYLILNDELDEQNNPGARTRFRTFDLANLSNPVVVANYYGPTTDIDHNTYIRGSRGYVAHYRRGLVVLDVNDPLNLREAGFFDSAVLYSAAPQFNGAWGTYPYFPSGQIVISDIENGLYVVRDNTVASGKGRLGFGVSHYRAAETAGSLSIPVFRSGGASGTVSVRVQSVDGTAVAGQDYTAIDTVLNWADGERGSKHLTLPLLDDSDIEPLESLQLQLTVNDGAEADLVSRLRVDVKSNESAGLIDFASTASTVFENAGTVTLTIQRSGGSSGAASVQFSTADGSAAAGSDYDAASGTVNWADGETGAKTLSLTVRDDSASEADETFTVTLSAVSGASAGNLQQITVTVRDNDTAATPPSSGGSGGGSTGYWAGVVLLVLAAMRRNRARRSVDGEHRSR